MPRNHRIIFRQGTTTPGAANFEVGEPAWDKTGKKLYIKAEDGTMVEIAGGGGGSVGPISETQQVISADLTISTGYNGMSVGPVEVAATYSVTVPENATWVVL